MEIATNSWNFSFQIYIFGELRGVWTPRDINISLIYSGFVADFVKTGNPSSGNNQWKPWDYKLNNYFKISEFVVIETGMLNIICKSIFVRLFLHSFKN